jgi:CUB domain
MRQHNRRRQSVRFKNKRIYNDLHRVQIIHEGATFLSSYIFHLWYKQYLIFRIAYVFLRVGESVGCGGHINISQHAKVLIGSYSQRGIGGNYENMLDCRWYIRASPGDSVKFTVNNFEVKDNMVNTSSCTSDYLEVNLKFGFK